MMKERKQADKRRTESWKLQNWKSDRTEMNINRKTVQRPGIRIKSGANGKSEKSAKGDQRKTNY